MTIVYSVKFAAGRYKVLPPGAMIEKAWTIGRDDDGVIIGFAFEEEQAKHICLALNLVDAYIGGDTTSQRDILKALERFRH
jgi:hypothetical protein